MRQVRVKAIPGLLEARERKMFRERVGFIVWVSDAKAAKNLDKYGVLHYVSKRMNYAVLYGDADQAQELERTLLRLPYVRKVERSYRNEILAEYLLQNSKKSRSQPAATETQTAERGTFS